MVHGQPSMVPGQLREFWNPLPGPGSCSPLLLLSVSRQMRKAGGPGPQSMQGPHFHMPMIGDAWALFSQNM